MKDDDGRTLGMLVRVGVVEHAPGEAVNWLNTQAAIDECLSLHSATERRRELVTDEFLAEVKGLPYRDLAVETLPNLLNDEIRLRSQRHLVQARSFTEMLEPRRDISSQWRYRTWPSALNPSCFSSNSMVE